ncbi:YkgJ family cysteine cluster protein [Sulfurisphaera javensis]|uniref:YkgJ family cysteine cluster protein n=1 Tax=Sulfurisphaera javensis TaxID=2049879 RepID=A0AAT9GQ42_9CREN
MNTDQINVLVKKALKGDIKSLEEVFNFLEKFNVPITKYAMYSIIYQYVMNNVLDLGKYCEECGGKCCKSGLPVPVYNFDYKELKNRLSKEQLNNFRRVNGFYILSRPCPFQEGWLCKIHQYKPYACMSYPFATEDEQKEIIDSYKDGIPDFKVPDFCIAGKKVKEFMSNKVDELRKKLGRDPTPRELLREIVKSS